jgi:hypothetical protein
VGTQGTMGLNRKDEGEDRIRCGRKMAGVEEAE